MAKRGTKAIRDFAVRLEERVANGLEMVAMTYADLLKQKVTENQTTPVGSHKRRGEIFKGEVVERSAPGEYPYREEGTLAQSIGWMAYDYKTKRTQAGVTEEGLHLFFLEFGHHWVSGEAYNRLGMVQLYRESRETLAEVFKQGFSL